MKNCKLFALVSGVFLPPLVFASPATPAASFTTQNLIDRTDGVALSPVTTVGSPSLNQNNQPPSTQVSGSPNASDSPLLPFWGKEAKAEGYDLPETYGVGINYMNMHQNINVGSIVFSGLSLGTLPIDSSMFNINAGHTRQESKTETLRLDAWILPFMNIYGIIGYTKGSSLSQVGVSVLGIKPPALQNLDFKLDFKGTTYGAGTTFAWGYDNVFTTLDMNYTQTQFDILDGSIDAFTLTPRIGYRFATPALSGLSIPQGKLNVWVGSMYQNVQQEFKGNLSDLNMPAELLPMINMVNSQGKGRFDVKQHLQSPWNVLLGAQYELTRHFSITTEFGFAQRNSLLVSGEYRF